MTTVSRGITFGATEQVTNAKLHTLVDSATISSIVNADISAAAAIDESKINFDGSTVCKLGTTQTVTGNKTFSTLTNIYNMIGSLASINTIQSQTQRTNNFLASSLASFNRVNTDEISAFTSSLASITSLNVSTLNGVSPANLASYAEIHSCECSNFGDDVVGSSNMGLFGTWLGSQVSYGTTMISSGFIGNIKYFASGTTPVTNSLRLYKNFSSAWLLSATSLASFAATGSLVSFAAGDLLSWNFKRNINSGAHQSVTFKLYQV